MTRIYVADTDNNRVQWFSTAGAYQGQWGSAGAGNGEFGVIYGLAIAPDGTVYVADTGNNRIQYFDVMGAYLGQWGSAGAGDGEFNTPAAVAVAPDGTVYVADYSNHRVQYFSAAGVFQGKWGSNGSGNGEFSGPHGITVAPDGTVYVCDYGNNRIQYFSAVGVYQGKWGSGGLGDGEFSAPAGVAVATDGTVYVADTSNKRVQYFSATGVFQGKWGSAGMGDGQFSSTRGIDVAPDGTVYVVDSNHRIQYFSAAGVFQGKWGSNGSGNGEFDTPSGVAVLAVVTPDPSGPSPSSGHVLPDLPGYAIWRCNDAYAKQALLERWLLIRYRIALNQVESLHVEFAADYAKLSALGAMDRIRLLRDGVDVFGGLVLGIGWAISEAAPAEDIYAMDCLSHAIYADWRTIPRPAGSHFDTVTDAADDVARSFVRRHLGSSASTGRPFTDITVEADTNTAASTTRNWVGGTVLEHLQRLADADIYWRFVPGASGATFTVKTALWGLDRTAGNGVNDELVLAMDRHNVRAMTYRQDLLSHYNTLYMAGAGEGKDQLIEIRANSTWATAYKRRERWISATNLVSAGELQTEGDAQLAQPEIRPVEELSVEPLPGVITPSNLGDKVTVRATRYGRTVSSNGVITAIEFEIGPDGIEYARPEITV